WLAGDDDGIHGRAVCRFTGRQTRRAGRLHGRAGSRRKLRHPLDHARWQEAKMTSIGRLTAAPLSRRRFVQGVAATGALASALPLRQSIAALPGPVLTGTEFRLEIGPMPISITGQPRIATAINGTIPGPTLRWREGDIVALWVTNRL